MSANRNTAWRHFFRNRLAMAGTIVFAVFCVLSVFAVILSTDSTPDAARQVPEATRLPPGSQLPFLRISNRNLASEFSIRYAFLGQPDRYTRILLQNSDSCLVHQDTLLCLTYAQGWRKFLLPIVYANPDPQLPFNAACLLKWQKPYAIVNDQYIWQNATNFESIPVQQLHAAVLNNQISTYTWYLGSDGLGRDLYSRLLLGARISIAVGLVSVLISLSLGLVLGAIAGYAGGRLDALIMWFVSIVWSLPSLLLAMVLSFVLGKGFWQVFVAVGATLWVDVARIVRGQVMSLREMSYVEAARALGYSHTRILFRHIVPNLMGPLMILSASIFASAVLVESGLSFLGIGIQAPAPSWGGLIREGYSQILLSGGQWLAIFPGLAITLLVVSLNLIGYGLRDAFDPKRSE